IWPTAAVKGDLAQELPLPEHFQQAAQMIGPDDVAESVVCGPDPQRYLEKIAEYEAAGYDHVYIHQVGRDQEGFLRFYEQELAPRA
ncbi:MAG: LLM class F420-dependent oxidoreductase, partial [Gaiellaceae bacterium]